VGGVQVTSWLKRLLSLLGLQQQDQYADVYVEGWLRDYYGAGVPNRPVTVWVETPGGYAFYFNLTTDASGYFRTPLFKALRGTTYTVRVEYAGDNIYVGTIGTASFTPEQLPSAPAFGMPGIGIKTLLGAIIALIVVAVVAAAIRSARRTAKHIIEEYRARSMRFVKKKHA